MFLQVVPLCAVSSVLVWYGMPKDSLQLERFHKADWRGALLIVIGFGSLTTFLQQGDRLDWFNSPLICVLGLLSVVAIGLLAVNEWFHELPLIKIQLLGRRNLAYGVSILLLFVIVSLSASQLPANFLAQVQGFRPQQAYIITAEIAASQLVLLPLMALLLNISWVDSRVVSFIGMTLILGACLGDAYVTSAWNAEQFFLWQGLQAVGEPMVVMPLLMMATNTVKNPSEGPFASALVNGPRSIAEATGVWLTQIIIRRRGGLHYNRLVDQLGERMSGLAQLHGLGAPSGASLAGGGLNLSVISRALQTEAAVMTLSDTFLTIGAMTVGMMVILLVLPERTYPPRIVFAKN